MMVLHIRSLDEETLAYRIYKEQQEKSWPGLAMETKQICEDLGVTDCNSTTLSKHKYRKIVTEACHERNRQMLLSAATEVKCARMKTEEYGKKRLYRKENNR